MYNKLYKIQCGDIMKISVSSYSFSQYIRAGKLTLFDTIAKAKEIGFDAIEFIDLIVNSEVGVKEQNLEEQIELAKKLKAEADRLGMDINAYTIGSCMCKETDAEDDAEFLRLKGQLQVAKALGAKVMRHDACGTPQRFRSFDLSVPTLANNFRRVTDYAASLGIKTCFENHGIVCQDYDRCERLFNAIDHPNFGLLVDMGNFICVDDDPIKAVSRLAPYAIHAHAKDFHLVSGSEPKPEGYAMTRGGNFRKGSIIGEGNVPVKQCIRILKMAGYDGYLSIEFEGVEDCIEGIKKGFENLKRFIAEVENE